MQRAVRLLALAGGLCVALTGLLAGRGGGAAALLSGADSRLVLLLAAASIAIPGVLLGGAVAWQGWQSIAGVPSRPWRPGGIGIALLLLVLAAALAAGAWASGSPALGPMLLPVAHVLAAALPPAILLALVSRSLGGPALRRHLLAQAGSGAFLSTASAMLAEALLIAGLVAGAVAVAAALPGGRAQLEELARLLEGSSPLAGPAQWATLARSPWLWAAALAVASVAVPLVEESVKTLGVGLMLYRRPTRAEAYLWGAAGGAGFAMVESALNALLGLQSWAAALLLRIPATFMHCFTGALMGLAWHAALVERRWKRGLALFALCVSLHGTWNALAVASGLLSLGHAPAAVFPGGATPLARLLEILLLPLAAGIAVAFGVVTRRLRPPAPDGPAFPPPPLPGPGQPSPWTPQP